MAGKCARAHLAEATCSFCEAFSAITTNFSSHCCQRGGGVKAVLLGNGTQYLVDLEDFSLLLGGGAALGGRAILVLGAVVVHEGNQQLKAAQGTKHV